MKKSVKILLLILLLLSLTLTAFSCKEKSIETVASSRFDLTNQVLEFIKQTYFDDLDYDVADVYTAYGLVSSLGKYNYINSVSDLLASSSDGTGFGLLIRNTKYNERLIDFILDGSPFLKPSNGITPMRGDEIYAIENVRVSGVDSSTYSSYLTLLPSDREVTFTLRRDGAFYDVSYQKVSFNFPYCVYVNDLQGVPSEFGYIFLRSFASTKTHQVESEFQEAVRSFIADGNRALILDLRGNGGGSSAVFSKVASALIGNVAANEPLLEVQYAKRGTSSIVRSTAVEYKVDTPIYVLCDGGTASASEALIGTMQAHGTLTALIGQNTVGKGVAQNGSDDVVEDSVGYFQDKGLNENGEEIDLDAYLVQVVVGKYYIYDANREGGKYCMHEQPFVPDVRITNENPITPDYGEDLYVAAAMDLYYSQNNS